MEELIFPRAFVPYWFQNKSLQVRGNQIYNANNKPYELSMVFNAMWLDYREELIEFNADLPRNERIRPFPEKDLLKALEEFLEVKRQLALEEAKKSIEFNGENDHELRRFIVAVTGRCDEMELAVYKHLLWQVKRKMFGKKVFDHMMIVMMVGKVAERPRLLRPFSELSSRGSSAPHWPK